MSNEELARLLQNLVRVGSILAIDHEGYRVRVKSGHLETDWLPWVEARSGNTKTWNPPTVGEQVVMFSPGGDLSAAIVLASVNSDANPPPSNSPDETVCRYPDGAVSMYNHQSGAFSLTGIKTLTVDAADSITLKAGQSITLDAPASTSTGTHTIEGLLTYLAGMAGENGEGGSTTISGNMI